MMQSPAGSEYFTPGVATGAAFCNREAERALLAQYIARGRHAWLAAPRRYGKTSLIQQVLVDVAAELPIRSCFIDIFLVRDYASLEALLLHHLGRLIAELMPAPQKGLKFIQQVFQSFRPELVFRDDGFQVRLFSKERSPAGLLPLFEGIEKTAREFDQRVVVVLDEFQQLGEVDEYHSVEAVIRSFAQQAESFSFVFSGSNRMLLSQMFENQDRPLYHLCYKINLERIGIDAYRAFMSNAWRNRWKDTLDDAVFARIMAISQRHPFYVSVICDRLWYQATAPDLADVDRVWATVFSSEQSRIRHMIESLPAVQRATLLALAADPTHQPTSKEFLSRHRLSPSSTHRTVNTLLEANMVYQDDEGYFRILDPAIDYFLNLNAPPES